jgi:hypothetical protein
LNETGSVIQARGKWDDAERHKMGTMGIEEVDVEGDSDVDTVAEVLA